MSRRNEGTTSTPSSSVVESNELDALAVSDSNSQPDVEDLSEQEEVEVSAPEKAKAETPAKGPKRGTLPETNVTPVGLAKILTEKKLHQNKDGVVIEVKPQMVYSYMKNSGADDRLETHEIMDSNGQPRQVFDIETAVAWWERKNARVVVRKQNAADKATKSAEAAKAKADKPATEEAEGSTELAVEAE